MTADKPGNLANLQRAAAGRTAAATARVEAALDRMLRAGQPVTFRGVAAAAPASLDFLYRTPAIRQRIEQLRSQQAPPAPRCDSSPGQPGHIVAALTGQLTDLRRRHREQIAELQHALETAHGENLILRRRLGQSAQQTAREQLAGESQE
jgi:hypothetical protein